MIQPRMPCEIARSSSALMVTVFPPPDGPIASVTCRV